MLEVHVCVLKYALIEQFENDTFAMFTITQKCIAIDFKSICKTHNVGGPRSWADFR